MSEIILNFLCGYTSTNLKYFYFLFDQRGLNCIKNRNRSIKKSLLHEQIYNCQKSEVVFYT